MKYLLILAADESTYAAPGTPEAEAEMERFAALGEELEAAGALLGGEELELASTATTVRVRGRDTLVTDGPFAETKEALGGYFVLDVPSLDDAIAWAARIPVAEYGSVEIRPIREWS
ncbi:YciI family protein [Okibacterium endophyticum]